jgi:TRAP-type C4-dicarboxylate transport system permease small subunit
MILQADLALRKVEGALRVVSWLVTLFTTFLIVTDVFLRFFFNKPLPATWEMSEVLMPYIVFLGFAYALTEKAHIRVSLLTDRLSRGGQLACEAFADLLSFAVCALITCWSWLWFWDSFRIGEEILAPIHIPWWLGKFAMPVGMAFFTVRYLVQAACAIVERSNLRRG